MDVSPTASPARHAAPSTRHAAFLAASENFCANRSFNFPALNLVRALRAKAVQLGPDFLKPDPGQDIITRKLMAACFEQMAAKGNLEDYDRLRDLHRILLSARWPTLHERCERVLDPVRYRDFASLLSSLLSAENKEHFFDLLAPSLAECSTAHGLAPTHHLERERGHIVGAMRTRGFEVESAKEFILQRLYDSRRIRLIASDGNHALRLVDRATNEIIPIGVVLGQISGVCIIVGYD